ncbi:MAG: dipeptidase [Bacteroidales bacterium]|jgi:membrane dipeptidase|nr:dipeptidase [Bacteroidales bacterium]
MMSEIGKYLLIAATVVLCSCGGNQSATAQSSKSAKNAKNVKSAVTEQSVAETTAPKPKSLPIPGAPKHNAYNLSDAQYYVLADSVHNYVVSFDTHNDTATYMMHPNGEYTVPKGQVSFALMKKGGLDAAFFAVYLEQGPWKNKKSLDSAYHYCKSELLSWKKYVTTKKSDVAGMAYTPQDVLKLKAQGKRAVILAIENGYPLGDDVNRVDEFFKIGVRYITLSHNAANQVCDGSREWKTACWHGVSPFGYKVIERMEKLGMIVDISHVSSEALKDVLKVAKAPVIASHSACRALKPSQRRDLTDEEIKMIAANGGVVQIGTGRFFLSDDLPAHKVGVAVLANHIDHVKNLVGPQYVGLGTDFDGGGGVVGMDNAGQMKNLTVELLKRGWTTDELQMFWGGNLMRVWNKCIEVSSKLNAAKQK